MTKDKTPELSVIVTIVDGGPTLQRCLGALAAQIDAPDMEVIVPYDDTTRDAAQLQNNYPNFNFIDLGSLSDSSPGNAYDEHELFDKRRSGGLLAAKADLMAIIEDRGAPKTDWAREMYNAHQRHADGVIGGAVESDVKGLIWWAIFFLDFGRYQAPFDTEHPEYVTDTNICYKRGALEKVKPLWQDMYQESAVNWAIRDNGETLRLDPAPVTLQRRAHRSLGHLAQERFHWGRIYGQVRARGTSFAGRLKWILVTPILPLVLYVRNFRRQLRLGRHVGKYIAATPAMGFLLMLWSLGELIGYFQASGQASED